MNSCNMQKNGEVWASGFSDELEDRTVQTIDIHTYRQTDIRTRLSQYFATLPM